jgi:hypothetical protein
VREVSIHSICQFSFLVFKSDSCDPFTRQDSKYCDRWLLLTTLRDDRDPRACAFSYFVDQPALSTFFDYQRHLFSPGRKGSSEQEHCHQHHEPDRDRADEERDYRQHGEEIESLKE